MHLSPKLAAAVAAVWFIACAAAAAAEDCPAPKTLSFKVESQIERDVLGLTQGLEFHGDVMFESTGPIAGATRLNTIDRNGHVKTLINYGNKFFGEGLTILDDRIFQLSWQEHLVLVYNLKGALLREMTNPREGWGLTNDGKSLIFTDGGDRLYFVDPSNFAIKRSVPVRLGAERKSALNELEYVDGKIYANVFTTNTIVRVAPQSGCIDATADLSGLYTLMSEAERDRLHSDGNFVLNGIAYDHANSRFYLTGKNWKTLFVGRFEEAN
jgi:glutaminyl-peptide cyclotransferase